MPTIQTDTAVGDGGFLGGYPDVDNRSCRLLGPTALIVQGTMGILVILSLIYKRQREKPKRPWRIWLFDVSKQVVGQMFVHGVNVLVSDLISHYSSANACVFYFLNILIDTTLGVAVIYLILHAFTYLLSEQLHLRGFESGKYGNPPSFMFWARQATIYVLALTTMKFLVLGILIMFPPIFKLGEWLLSWTWTKRGDALQVIFTMGIFPILMNVLQFWLIDSIVKASSAVAPVTTESDGSLDYPDLEPLFHGSSDDDDNDSAHDVENPQRTSRTNSASPSLIHEDKSITNPLPPYEHESSGSSTPGQIVEHHTYPPTLSSSSPTNTLRMPKPGKQSSKRRSPPSPLSILPLHQPAINSPQKTAFTPNSNQYLHPSALAHPIIGVSPHTANDWADSWQDADDWANRVGEEDWTGRRLEQKKEGLNAWNIGTPSIHVGS